MSQEVGGQAWRESGSSPYRLVSYFAGLRWKRDTSTAHWARAAR
ncbi:hypothetical protein [Streptomyces syringium]